MYNVRKDTWHKQVIKLRKTKQTLHSWPKLNFGCAKNFINSHRIGHKYTTHNTSK